MLPLMLASLVFLHSLGAQSRLGSVPGLALDPALAAIASARIRLLSVDTGVKRETATNSSGAYTFPNLAPGRYKLVAGAKGFPQWHTPEFTLAAHHTLRHDLHFILQAAATEGSGAIPIAAWFQSMLNHGNLGQPNLAVTAVQGGTITSTHIFPAAGRARTG